MGRAKFKLSTHRLEQLLGLPYNARITEIIQTKRQYYPKEILIYVEHPDLPNEVEIFPQWKEITRREFIDWGIPK